MGIGEGVGQKDIKKRGLARPLAGLCLLVANSAQLKSTLNYY